MIKKELEKPIPESLKTSTKEEYVKKVLDEFKGLWVYGHPEFYELVIEMCKIHEVKNKGYSKVSDPLSNFREAEDLGITTWLGIGVRLTDKYARFKNLAKNVGNIQYSDVEKIESLEDTLLDMANYSVLCLVAFREEKKKRTMEKILGSSREEDRACSSIPLH